MIYEVYKKGKLFYKYLSEEQARNCCIRDAAFDVDYDKRDIYYPYLREKYGVENIRDIPAEIRYKFWADMRQKYLKENYYIKVIDTTPSKEEREAFHQRVEEYNKKHPYKKRRR